MNELDLLNSFQRQPNGMWACIRPISISGPNGSMNLNPGASFGPGAAFMGINLFAELNRIAAKYGR